jgi:hypothetical protein
VVRKNCCTFAPSNVKNYRTMKKKIEKVENWKDLLKVINEDLKKDCALIGVMTDGDDDLYHIVLTYKNEDGMEESFFWCDNAEEEELGDMLNDAWANIRFRIKGVKTAKKKKEEEKKRKPTTMLVTFTITAKVKTKKLSVGEVIEEMDFAPRGGNVIDWSYEDPYMEEEEEDDDTDGDKVIYLVDKDGYSEEDIKKLSRKELEDLCAEDNYFEDYSILKIDANAYNSVEEALEGEGFDDYEETSILISFGFGDEEE